MADGDENKKVRMRRHFFFLRVRVASSRLAKNTTKHCCVQIATAAERMSATTAAEEPRNRRRHRQQGKRRVCLFGLSGDPPTGDGGHGGIVKALAASGEFDEIRILPVYRHTFSSKRGRLTPFEDRFRMCELAFLPLSTATTTAGGTAATDATMPTKVTVSDAEYRSWLRAAEGKSEEERKALSVGTAALLDYLQQSQEPAATDEVSVGEGGGHQQSPVSSVPLVPEFTLCLGADTFLDLTAGKWKESSRVLELVEGRIVVLLRKVGEGGVRESDGSSPRLLEDRIREVPGSRLLHVEHLDDVSSSRVRCCTDVDELRRMVRPEVLDYMRDRKLYACFGRDGDDNRK